MEMKLADRCNHMRVEIRIERLDYSNTLWFALRVYPQVDDNRGIDRREPRVCVGSDMNIGRVENRRNSDSGTDSEDLVRGRGVGLRLAGGCRCGVEHRGKQKAGGKNGTHMIPPKYRL